MCVGTTAPYFVRPSPCSDKSVQIDHELDADFNLILQAGRNCYTGKPVRTRGLDGVALNHDLMFMLSMALMVIV